MRPHSGLLTALPAALALFSAGPASAQRSAADQKIDSLVARMTLEEKLGQLNQLSVDQQPPTEQLELVRQGLVGSFLNLTGAAATRDAQHIAVTESRLHIPLIFGHDVIHGYRTIFPIPLGEAASWDPEAVQAAAHVAAKEAAAAGVHWTFAPMVDIARDPRWGRIAEGSGEDPHLGSAMAAARVRGFQGTDPRAPDAVLATVKHFAAYGGAEGGRDYNTVDLSERTLREVYLPPYRAALDAGAATVMTSFNEIGGSPSTASPWLMTTVLRSERAALLAPEHRQLARRVAEEAIVLLKNDAQLLPLASRVRTVAVIGPLADDKVSALGSWPGRGDPGDAVTPLEGIKARAGSVSVLYAKGCGITRSEEHTSELQSHSDLVCRLLLEKKKKNKTKKLK